MKSYYTADEMKDAYNEALGTSHNKNYYGAGVVLKRMNDHNRQIADEYEDWDNMPIWGSSIDY